MHTYKHITIWNAYVQRRRWGFGVIAARAPKRLRAQRGALQTLIHSRSAPASTPAEAPPTRATAAPC